MDEKKKLMILGALGLVFVAMGAFTLMPKGKEPAVAAEPAKSEFAQKLAAEAAPVEPKKNPLVANSLSRRDPFSVPAGAVVSNFPANMEPERFVAPKPAPQIQRLPGAITLQPARMEGGLQEELPTVAPVSPELPPFSYTVAGVVVGKRPAVVFKDAQGNQRLVVQGSSLDGDSTVKAVRLNEVVVSYHGKTLRLPVGGESVAE